VALGTLEIRLRGDASSGREIPIVEALDAVRDLLAELRSAEIAQQGASPATEGEPLSRRSSSSNRNNPALVPGDGVAGDALLLDRGRIGIAVGAGGRAAVLAALATLLVLLTLARRLEAVIRSDKASAHAFRHGPRPVGAVGQMVAALTEAGAAEVRMGTRRGTLSAPSAVHGRPASPRARPRPQRARKPDPHSAVRAPAANLRRRRPDQRHDQAIREPLRIVRVPSPSGARRSGGATPSSSRVSTSSGLATSGGSRAVGSGASGRGGSGGGGSAQRGQARPLLDDKRSGRQSPSACTADGKNTQSAPIP
jgi:uncharacterized membrane protein YgcG